MKRYSYRYTDDDGKPVLRCPQCESRWIYQGSLYVECIVGEGDLVTFESLLRQDGWLNDVSGLIACGNHSKTMCAHCTYGLSDLPGVVEVQHVDQNTLIEVPTSAHDLDVDQFIAALSPADKVDLLRGMLDALVAGSGDKLKSVLDHWVDWTKPDTEIVTT